MRHVLSDEDHITAGMWLSQLPRTIVATAPSSNILQWSLCHVMSSQFGSICSSKENGSICMMFGMLKGRCTMDKAFLNPGVDVLDLIKN
jgi:hypothetical protein